MRPRGTASGISVWCLHDKIVGADTLKPFPDGNYRIHKAVQLDRFETVVAGSDGKKGNGWRRPIVLSQRGYIVRGHGAWQMAKRRGWEVPIEIQKYATLAEEIRDLIADNHLAELAENDDAALQKLFGRLDPGDITLTGYSEDEFKKLIEDAGIPEADFPITAKLHEGYDYVLIATTNETEFAFLQNLLGIVPERSYKKTGVGIGRVIMLERALVALRANRHSLDVQGGDDDHAQAPPKRGRVRPRKPSR